MAAGGSEPDVNCSFLKPITPHGVKMGFSSCSPSAMWARIFLTVQMLALISSQTMARESSSFSSEKGCFCRQIEGCLAAWTIPASTKQQCQSYTHTHILDKLSDMLWETWQVISTSKLCIPPILMWVHPSTIYPFHWVTVTRKQCKVYDRIHDVCMWQTSGFQPAE